MAPSVAMRRQQQTQPELTLQERSRDASILAASALDAAEDIIRQFQDAAEAQYEVARLAQEEIVKLATLRDMAEHHAKEAATNANLIEELFRA